MTADKLMTAGLGWTIIVVATYIFSLAFVWPVSSILRRARVKIHGASWSYPAASGLFGLVLWIATPHIIHSLFGRTVH